MHYALKDIQLYLKKYKLILLEILSRWIKKKLYYFMSLRRIHLI